jgi:hypothetical protein
MRTNDGRFWLTSALLVWAGTCSALAADPNTLTPTTQPTQPTPFTARVIEVNGSVQYAPVGSTEWKPMTVGLELPEQTQVRTGIRGSTKLQLGQEEPFSVMAIDSVGLVVLAELYQTADTKRVKIGVGYGQVRAGVAAGGRQSDFTVECPVATLSKRGTWNFGLMYTRGSNEFEVFLLGPGLVDALNLVNEEHRRLQPGEWVTEAMRKWLDEAARRYVAVADALGQENADVAYLRWQTEGLGVLEPGSGKTALSASLSNITVPSAQYFAMLPGPILVPIGPQPSGTIRRPEGFFGTGRGQTLIDVIVRDISAKQP